MRVEMDVKKSEKLDYKKYNEFIASKLHPYYNLKT